MDGSFDFVSNNLLRLVPYRVRPIISDVGFASCDHLVCHLEIVMVDYDEI